MEEDGGLERLNKHDEAPDVLSFSQPERRNSYCFIWFEKIHGSDLRLQTDVESVVLDPSGVNMQSAAEEQETHQACVRSDHTSADMRRRFTSTSGSSRSEDFNRLTEPVG
ncbi:unnamed protein product [Pleuronectes platessa]|uniref:Uncharacterized protein n=1 Tax=Pleuronectes platessa TaxID=8262 RepID=A0A9N7ZCZ4_PLEPL|nr:unnamed protein product [Pleuronectes platessa]